MSLEKFAALISKQFNLRLQQVENTIQLLDGGATIPFISRYRKEQTGALNEVIVGDIQHSLSQLKELLKRKEFIIHTIDELGKLTPSLKKKIEDSWDQNTIEDLYLPFKKKRKTRATVAKENGLEPLAELILEQRIQNLHKEAKRYLSKRITSIDDALKGARDILAEKINETPSSRNLIRKLYKNTALISSKLVTKKKEEAQKYTDYFEYSEAASRAPAHRILAVFRAEKEGLLRVKLSVDEEEASHILSKLIIHRQCPYECEEQLMLAIKDALKRLLLPSIETEFRNIYKEKADDEAIHVFRENLKHLLLAPPLGAKSVLGIDPGFRSGCKVVCLDKNGELIYNSTIYPHPPQNQLDAAKDTLIRLVNTYAIEAIAIGNGTAGKETFALLKSLKFNSAVEIFLVNENGASIYSASEIARQEFPDFDLTVRGAVSIGRRLMDPLSELVKIDPKSIGVGQYQHDVNQTKLKEHLSHCVVHCVNAVGIDLNTASEHVLTYISGLGPTLAKNIVSYRTENGSFKKISTLKKVPRMGAKAYEQCAGFLRIRNGQYLLDDTGVHPERYALVEQIASDAKLNLEGLISNSNQLSQIDKRKYISSDVGLPTIDDILKELSKPGVDIRGSAKGFEFTKGIQDIADIKVGMMIKGIINNVTKFGAFVDLGIKEAGLIHISQLADRFVQDPMDVVKLNQEVYAKVIEVDLGRKRVSLSLKK